MKMDAYTDRLSEYLDGELKPAERAELERHLEGCRECRDVLANLRAVVVRAESLPDRGPERDLWAGIAARIAPRSAEPADPKVIELAGMRAPARRRRLSFTVPQLAAASVALMLVSGSAVWFALTSTRAAAPIGALPQPRGVTSVSNAGTAQYADAVRSLELALQQRRDQLDPVTVAVLEENLRTIDAAITEARGALTRDPANLYLNQHLENTMKKKIELLRRATALRGT
ncbi:MAG TPA: zf-HC2 domain-containing protein [Longimicrobiales bacterium]|nr:zf-HC2 domain-containing protein [Longimicrobiales bacterium]